MRKVHGAVVPNRNTTLKKYTINAGAALFWIEQKLVHRNLV